MTSVAPESNSVSPVEVGEPSRWFVRALAATTFLGAFLLFQVQPLIGEVVLPWFGGTPTVWTTSMLFFQTMLVVGYGFVYLTTRFLPPSVRSIVYLASAALCIAALPILPGVHWKPTPETDPTSGVLLLLVACVGAPYFLLSTTGPATQEWFARAYENRSPYRLYALSNLGSLLGLLTYPLLVQPLFTLTQQSRMWSIGFGVYAVLVGFCAWSVRRYADVPYTAPVDSAKSRHAKRRSVGETAAAPVAPRSRRRETAQWLGLSAGGSVLLLVTMNHLCQDISSFPLVRIAPLVVYLITFIICFDKPAWYYRKTTAIAVLVLVPLACWPMLEDPTIEFMRPRFLRVALVNLSLVFAGCMLCHGELAARKPEPQRLTFYYLMIAVGGALGGLFVGIVAPLIYDRYWEWILTSPAFFLFAAIVLVDQWTQAGYLRRFRSKSAVFVAVIFGLLVIGYNHLGREVRDAEVLASVRNFFGVAQVSATQIALVDGEVLQKIQLFSGSTKHGYQFLDSADGTKKLSHVPTSYYGWQSGIGRMLMARDPTKPIRMGVVGLGVGTLAAYGKQGDSFYFYEINPVVETLANDYFTFLKDCDASKTVILGDARLNLESEPAQEFDVLVLDAFSSDAIPTHLLTTEAFEIYLRHLAPDGVLAVHVSNRYLNLSLVMAAVAKHFELQGVVVRVHPDSPVFQENSRWVLMTRDVESPRWKATAATWKGLPENRLVPLDRFEPIAPWTDQHSNFWDVLE